MVTSIDAYNKFGWPEDHKNMALVYTPRELAIDAFPRRIYMNRVLIEPLFCAFQKLIDTCCYDEITTWDGCFNIRPKRGYEKKYKYFLSVGDKRSAAKYLSLHAWGLAVDINAFENKMHTKGKLSSKFVECFTSSGFDWGGNFSGRLDPMHFQLSKI